MADEPKWPLWGDPPADDAPAGETPASDPPPGEPSASDPPPINGDRAPRRLRWLTRRRAALAVATPARAALPPLAA